MHLTYKRAAAALLTAVLGILPVRAGILDHGLAKVFQDPNPIGGGPRVSYDADHDVLSVSSAVLYQTSLPCSGPPATCTGANMSGYQTLIANIDDSGTFLGGVFSFVGTAPSLGIVTPRLLLAATLTGSDSTIRVEPAPCAGDCQADLLLELNMRTVFADPVLGDWGRQMWFGGHAYGRVPTGVTPTSLYAVDWTLPGPADYWALLATNPVPEPSSASLAVLGLLGLWARRRWRGAMVR